MLIGLDFDNTIVRYDRLFHRLADERGLLGEPVAVNKTAVRDYLRRIGREPDWTEMQGVGYGPRIADAEPFPGVKDFLAKCLAAGAEVRIVSHKTKHPYAGPPFDLHEAAHNFLTAHGFYDTAVTGLSPERVNLALTKRAKIDRIAELGCDVFVDDLTDILAEPGFPAKTRKVLFDPADQFADDPSYTRAKSWADVTAAVFGRSA